MKFEKFNGLRNDISVEMFEPTDFAVADNVLIDKIGDLSMRFGQTQVRSGNFSSIWADDTGTIGMYVSGTGLYSLNPDMSGNLQRNDLTNGLRMSYDCINQTVYFSNSAQTGIYQNGAARTWGIKPPIWAPVVTTIQGMMPPATYQYTLTYVAADGQESGTMVSAAAPVITTTAFGGITLTLPSSTDPRVVAINIYITDPNGDTFFLAGTVPNGTATYTYSNDTTELNFPLQTAYLQPPPAGQLVKYYAGRMYVAVGDTIYRSQPYAYELFDLREYIQLDGRVTLMATCTEKEMIVRGVHSSGFYIGTTNSCGVMVGAEEFIYIPKMEYGAIEGAVDYVDGSVFGDDQQRAALNARRIPVFLTTNGLCAGMPDMVIKNLTRARYRFPAAGRGACLYQPGTHFFIASSNF